MVNIYIKSFNRPFYLDRCIRSIKFNVSGYNKIIVLDDGSLNMHLNEIHSRHPDIEIRSSGADDGKVVLLRAESFDEIARRYPSASEFWVTEIQKDVNEYVIVLEDDVWIVNRINLCPMVAELARQNATICKFWWGNETHSVTATSECPTGPTIDYFSTQKISLADAGKIWIVAFAIFRKKYWVDCVSKAKRLGDERSQLVAAISYATHNPLETFAKTRRRTVHQGWMVPARSTPEYYDRGLVQHLYMDAMNDAWAAGELESSQGYPFDFSVDYMTSILELRLSPALCTVWRDWHEREITYFYF